MHQTKKITLIVLLIGAACITITACLKKDFERPPDESHDDPHLVTTHSIAQLKALNKSFRSGDDTTLINEDVLITGIVTADDRSGNFYKSIVIEDTSGAIMVLIDAYSLYNDYPAGRKVYINCRGLYLGYDGGLPQLGSTPTSQLSLTGISGEAIKHHIIKANIGNATLPLELSFDAVKAINVKNPDKTLFNRLITITGVQFKDTAQTYTDPTATTNRGIHACGADSIVMRSSNYSNFSGLKLPSGQGKITGILTVYAGANGIYIPQLVIRGAEDVQFTEPRCNNAPASVTTLITIDSLRKSYPGAGTINPGRVSIKGIVISDRLKGNTDVKNMILQDGDRGIVIRFSATHSFSKGDSVTVDLSTAQLAEYNGLMETGYISGNNFPVSKAVKAGTNKTITPKQLTISVLKSQAFEDYESTLVKIVDATASGGATYTNGTSNTSRTLTDATGSITLFTMGVATFGSNSLPTGSVSWTGIAGQYKTANADTRQFSIRNTTDIE